MSLDHDAIRARADAATKGPWRTEPVERGRFAGVESRVYSAAASHILLSPNDGEAGQAANQNAEFIAHARTDVPALLDENARLRAALDAVKADALREAADEFAARLPDGAGNGRAYNSYQVARKLYERAAALKSEAAE